MQISTYQGCVLQVRSVLQVRNIKPDTSHVDISPCMLYVRPRHTLLDQYRLSLWSVMTEVEVNAR